MVNEPAVGDEHMMGSPAPFPDELSAGLDLNVRLPADLAVLLQFAHEPLQLATSFRCEATVDPLLQTVGDSTRQQVGTEVGDGLTIDAVPFGAQLRLRHRRQRSQFRFEIHSLLVRVQRVHGILVHAELEVLFLSQLQDSRPGVENHPAGATLISRNLASLGIPTARQVASHKTFAGIAEILRMDAVEALEMLAGSRARVDFVFADPPYANVRVYEDILGFLGGSDLLARNGLVIAEHRRKLDLLPIAGRLERTRVLEQGDSALSFYTPIFAA